MIEFEMTTVQQALSERIETFVLEQIVPFEKDERVTSHGPTEELRLELNGLAKAAGLFAPQVKQDMRGDALDHLTMAIAFEAAGLSPLGPIALHCAAPDEGNMNLLEKIATDDQKERWLKPLTSGEFRSCFAMTEQGGAGADPSKLQTKARYDGGEFIVNGRKWLITGAKAPGL